MRPLLFAAVLLAGGFAVTGCERRDPSNPFTGPAGSTFRPLGDPVPAP